MSHPIPALLPPSIRHWHAEDASALAEIDLAALMAEGLITAVEHLGEGGIRVTCPDEVPEAVARHFHPMAEPMDERIARIEAGLESLSQGLLARERLADRLDAVEFGLTERLQGMIAEELLDLAALPEAEGAAPVEEILSAVNDTGAAVLARFAMTEAQFSPIASALAELTERIAALEARPAPRPDLTAQRQSFAGFATALGTAVQRVEDVSDHLAALPAALDLSALQEGIAALAARPELDLSPLLQRLDALEGRPAPDLSGMEAAMARLTERPDPDLAPLAEAMAAMSERLKALEERPAPKLDLTAQRQSLAAFTVAMTNALQRMEAATDRLAAPEPAEALAARLDALAAQIDALSRRPEPSPLPLEEVLRRLDALAADLPRPADLSQLDRAMAALDEKVSALALPRPDLGEQRRSFANFATALGSMIRRVELMTDAWPSAERFAALETRLEAALAPRPDTGREALTDAILALADRAPLPDLTAFEAAQKEFFQDLRFLLAEIVASQIQRGAAAR